jgi:hypothetical protein
VTGVAELRGAAEFQSFTGFFQHGIHAAIFGIAHVCRLQE